MTASGILVNGSTGPALVNPPPLTGVGAPTKPGLVGQEYFDTSTSPRTAYTWSGKEWLFDAGSSSEVFSVTGTANQITATPTTGNVVLSLAGPYTPATYTAHGVLVGEGTGSIVALGVGATGTVLAGTTGADPAFTATPSVTTLTATTVHGTTIDTNVATAQLSFNGNTIDATGSNASVNLNITTKNAGAIVFAQSKAGVDQNMQITNGDNTAAAGNAGLQLAVGGSTSTGDPYVRFEISGVAASTMTMGLDNSAADIFAISNSNTLGTSNALTLTQAGALTATTTLTATLGDITATNGNIVRGTAGNKDIYSSVAANGTAGANSAGTATLAGGTITINTTAVTASSIIRLYRQGIGSTGAAALGILTIASVVAGASFVINSVQAADATALQASDVSVVAWEIVN